MSVKDRLIMLKDIGISYAFISEFIGLQSSTVGKYVRGEIKLSAATIERIDELSYNIAIALDIE